MAETSNEQRTRVLAAAPNTASWEYDLALALGYEPESWDGMWKLTEHPFDYRHGVVTAREVISAPLTFAETMAAGDDYKRKTRLKEHPLPEGWQILSDDRIGEAEPRYRFIPPGE